LVIRRAQTYKWLSVHFQHKEIVLYVSKGCDLSMRKNGGNIYGMKCEKDDDIDDGNGDDESEFNDEHYCN
jgi:hypothetical protein